MSILNMSHALELNSGNTGLNKKNMFPFLKGFIVYLGMKII